MSLAMEFANGLRNVVWRALSSCQACHGLGPLHARRFRPGHAPLVGFADPACPDLAALRPWVAEGESLYCDGWDGPVPEGWRLLSQTELVRMLWQGELSGWIRPAELRAPRPLRPLRASDAAAARRLAEVTGLSPFGEAGLTLGETLGWFEDGQLLGMAAERLQWQQFREIASVATHPQAQGRGIATALVGALLERSSRRGEQAFLHVRANNPARRLYERLGFRALHTVPARVICATG